MPDKIYIASSETSKTSAILPSAPPHWMMEEGTENITNYKTAAEARAAICHSKPKKYENATIKISEGVSLDNLKFPEPSDVQPRILDLKTLMPQAPDPKTGAIRRTVENRHMRLAKPAKANKRSNNEQQPNPNLKCTCSLELLEEMFSKGFFEAPRCASKSCEFGKVAAMQRKQARVSSSQVIKEKEKHTKLGMILEIQEEPYDEYLEEQDSLWM